MFVLQKIIFSEENRFSLDQNPALIQMGEMDVLL